MAAVDLLLGQLKPKDLVIAPHDCYGGTYRLLKARADRGHFSLRFIDQSNHSGGPRFIDSLEWFASPNDLARAMIDLRARGSDTAMSAMAINTGVGGGPAARWSYRNSDARGVGEEGAGKC